MHSLSWSDSMESPARSQREVNLEFFLEYVLQVLQYHRWNRSFTMSQKLASLYWDLLQICDASSHEIFIAKTNFRSYNP